MRWILCALVLGLSSAPSSAEPEAVPQGVRQAAGSSNAFAGRVYEALREVRGNLVFSPVSLFLELSMLLDGASGETAQEIEHALAAQGGGRDDRIGLMRWIAQPGTAGDYRCSFANAVLAQAGHPISTDFLRRVTADYGAESAALDLVDAGSAGAWISKWLDDKLGRRDARVFPPARTSTETRLVLVSSVHFRASWERRFEETETGEFTTAGGVRVQVPMMRNRSSQEYTYGETRRAQVLRLPYLGGQASMLVVLPKTLDGLPGVEHREGVRNWISCLEERTSIVRIRLPRFRFGTSHDVAKALSRLSITRAMTPEAELSAISPEPGLRVGQVLHDASIAVDEKGTTAEGTSRTYIVGGDEDPVSFVADHPFLFLVLHEPTGAILFMGRVVNPAE